MKFLAASLLFLSTAALAQETPPQVFAEKWDAIRDRVNSFSLLHCIEPACFYFKGYQGTKFEIIRRVQMDVNMYVRYVWEQGLNDYWQLPGETLKSGTGDCEDYAILKIAILKHYGIEARLVIVKPPAMQVYHAVAVARDGNDWVVLDNDQQKRIVSLGVYPYQPVMVGSLTPAVAGLQ